MLRLSRSNPVQAVLPVSDDDDWTDVQMAALLSAVKELPLEPGKTRWRRISEAVWGDHTPRECYQKHCTVSEKPKPKGPKIASEATARVYAEQASGGSKEDVQSEKRPPGFNVENRLKR